MKKHNKTMKPHYYNPSDEVNNIVRDWIYDPPECDTPKGYCYMTACLMSLASAYNNMKIAFDYSDEGNDEQISKILKSIEVEISKYSLFVSLKAK